MTISEVRPTAAQMLEQALAEFTEHPSGHWTLTGDAGEVVKALRTLAQPEGVTLSREDARTTLRLLVAHANATESIQAAQICGKLRNALGAAADTSESASWEERMQMEPPVVNGMRLFWAQEDSEVYCGRTLEDVRAYVEKLIGEPLPDDQIGEVTYNSKFRNEDGSKTTLFEAFVAENPTEPTQISTHYY